MAGHSKWANIRHKKGAADAKRGKLFSRLTREVTIAARTGGGDLTMNPRLRTAVNTAKAQNMPNDTIDRAIKKGTGELGGEAIEEMMYEGYAPGGVAVLVEAATDNKNRTAAEVRMVFSKNNGNLGTSGSVSYLFQRKGHISVPADSIDEDSLLDAAIEAGAEEMTRDNDHFVVITAYDKLYEVADALGKAGIASESQVLVFVPETSVPVADEQTAGQILKLCDALEDLDDVLNVHANFEIEDALLEKVSS